MDIENLLKDITPAMLPPRYKRIAEAVGIPGLYSILENAGGKEIYLRKPDDFILKYAIKPKIVQDWKSGRYSKKHLAEKYQLSPKTIGAYIKEADTKKPM